MRLKREPREGGPSKIGQWVKGIPASISLAVKSLFEPNPAKMRPIGGWCAYCGEKGHSSRDCPRDLAGHFKSGGNSAPRRRKPKKGDVDESASPDQATAA